MADFSDREEMARLVGEDAGRFVREHYMKGKPVSEELKRDEVDHYTVGGTETIDYIFEKLGFDGGMAVILGNILKYGSRAKHKGQFRSDLVKIRNYATIGIEKYDEHEADK